MDSRSITGDEETYIYLVSLAATLFCLVIHLYLCVAYAFFNVGFFVYLNIGSITVYCLLLVLHQKRRHKMLAIALSAEVSIYATVTVFLSGISTYVVGYYLLAIIFQVILPYGSVRLRVGIGGAIVLLGFPGILYSLYNQPMLLPNDTLDRFLILSNIYILLLGTVVELCVGNAVHTIVERLNETRIETLSTMANTDPLTGLFNRRYAETYFSDILTSRGHLTYCVAMLDIDDFKQVNDSYGHGCGDEVLVFLANFLTKNLRRSDLIFRWGGEEFLMVLESIELPMAYTILDKLRGKLETTTIPTAAGPLSITVTIGVSALDITQSMESIQKSDSNLYIGKQKSKNIVVAG